MKQLSCDQDKPPQYTNKLKTVKNREKEERELRHRRSIISFDLKQKKSIYKPVVPQCYRMLQRTFHINSVAVPQYSVAAYFLPSATVNSAKPSTATALGLKGIIVILPLFDLNAPFGVQMLHFREVFIPMLKSTFLVFETYKIIR